MEQSAFGFIEDGKVIRKAFADFTDRIIGEVEESEEATMKLLEEKYLSIEKEVKDIAAKIESSANKGSFKTKVENLLAALPEYDAIGDFQALHDQLTQLLTQLKDYVEQNRHKNLQIKTALLEQLKPFADSHEWKTATAAIKEIQQKWLKTGAVAEEKREQIEGHYQELISSFYDRKNEFYADLNKMMEEKEKDFETFVQEAKSLLEIKDLNLLKTEIKKTTESWKQLGKLKPTRHTHYWNQLQEIIKQALTQSKKLEKKKKSKSPEQVMKEAKELIDELESAISEVRDLNTQELRTKWKSIGQVKHKAYQELSDRFYFLSDYIEERKFIETLALKKAKNKEADLKTWSAKVCRDLLERDKRELLTFEENLGKFNMNSGLDQMLGKKLEQQKRKVSVKQAILKDLRDSNK